MYSIYQELCVNFLETLLIFYLLNTTLMTEARSPQTGRGLPGTLMPSLGVNSLVTFRKFGGGAVLVFVSTALSLLDVPATPLLHTMLVFDMAFAAVCFPGSLTTRLFWGAAYTAIEAASHLFALTAFGFLLNQGLENLFTFGEFDFGLDLLTLIFSWILVFLLTRFSFLSLRLPRWPLFLFLVHLICVTSASERLLSLAALADSTGDAAIYKRICLLVVSMPFLSIAVMVVLGKVCSQNDRLLQRQLIDKAEKEQFSLMTQSIEALRAWRHDIKNQLMVMKTYLDRKNYEGLEQYFLQLSQNFEEVSHRLIHTGCDVLDTILSVKLLDCEKNRITLNYSFSLTRKVQTQLSDPELASLIANVLDNAIEACCRLETRQIRYISITASTEGHQLFLMVTNSYDGLYAKKGEQFLTRKSGPEHGLGLKRIQSLAARGGGSLLIQPQEKDFSVKILLPLSET